LYAQEARVRYIIDCFIILWNCVGDPSKPTGPKPAPEIDATNSIAVIALLLSVTVVVYRQWQQECQQ
jgi:hypothetical protein